MLVWVFKKLYATALCSNSRISRRAAKSVKPSHEWRIKIQMEYIQIIVMDEFQTVRDTQLYSFNPCN